MKKYLKILGFILLGIALIASCYVAYVFIDYKRIEDNTEIVVTNVSNLAIETNKEYSILTYNIGYGSYPQDYTFFMEGGTESIARSKEDVNTNINGSIDLVKKYNPDIVLLQEVDIKGDRSYKVNEFEQIKSSFLEYNNLYAINYDSSYLLYPFKQPIGKNKSSIALFSKFAINSTIRRSLPISNAFSKFFDLDRCYTVSEINVNNGKKLYLYNVHLTAYGGSDEIRTEQIKMLSNNMSEKIKNGNYVICGGDFNSDVLLTSFEKLNPNKEIPEWAKPLLVDLLPEEISVATTYENDELIPTSRSLSTPYNKETSEVMVIDGFLISNDIEVSFLKNIDNQFIYSDHNPVLMKFSLKSSKPIN